LRITRCLLPNSPLMRKAETGPSVRNLLSQTPADIRRI
jgi:hypothetical protein